MKRWALAAAVFMTALGARADEQVTKARAFAKAGTQKPKLPHPERPTPNLKLQIETPTTRGPWLMRVTNASSVPVRLVADARLLNLDVMLRGARTAIHCELPADMRQSDDAEHSLVVAPERSYAESFEPRLYCFGSKLDTLAPGAIVVARLGWTSGSRTEPPYEASPIDGIAPEVAPVKWIESSPVALPDEPSPSLLAKDPAPDGENSEAFVLSLQASKFVDADSPNDIEIGVTIRNDGAQPATVRFRPESLAFDLLASSGVEHCAWPVMPAAAMLEMFSTVRPKGGAETLHVTLDSYCSGHGLDQSGLIVVLARLDTRKGSGAAVGLHTFDGELATAMPTLVRLHRGAAPRSPQRPKLEEQQP